MVVVVVCVGGCAGAEGYNASQVYKTDEMGSGTSARSLSLSLSTSKTHFSYTHDTIPPPPPTLLSLPHWVRQFHQCCRS